MEKNNRNSQLLQKEWEVYLKNFWIEFDYPEEAVESLERDMNKVISCQNVWEIFETYDREYSENIHMDYGKIFRDLEQSADSCGVSPYTLHLLFLAGLSRKTRKLYRERKIPESIFRDSMKDLYWKLLECYKLYGIWGTFVAEWMPWWFELRRFALGRFQYELIEFEDIYEKNGVSLHPGDKVVQVHIPSAGPLKREEYLKSYKIAAEFYKDVFGNGPVIFFCESWLLFPKHRKFLPETSNILGFMSDYYIYKEEYTNQDLWRIFYKDCKKMPKELPEDTRLQRAYKSWLMTGHTGGVGFGIFPFQ
ncbi:MAG: acyltransferase domain-containing protein [Blautia sp.]